MATRRRGAYSAGMLTLAVFLAPALFAPGQFELANFAGIALAFWLASDASHMYRRTDIGETLPYRVAPVGPGILGSAALIFTVAILYGWVASSGSPSTMLSNLLNGCKQLWDFPFSPLTLLSANLPGAPAWSENALNNVTLSLTAAAALGLFFGVFSLFGFVGGALSLRRHALIWKGAPPSTAAENLDRRGARGLRPMRNPMTNLTKRPVSGRLMLRALALVVAVVTLAYTPVLLRLLMGLDTPQAQRFFTSPFFELPFFSVWFTGIWATLLASATIMTFAYLRLAVALRRR